jgi:hypothetical protein
MSGGDQLVSASVITACARELDPEAFTRERFDLKRGCQSPWHCEGHSYHSTCPSCGGKYVHPPIHVWRQRMRERRAAARREARLVLRTAQKELSS